MKNSKLIFFFVSLSTLTLFFSCKKEEKPSPDSPIVTESFSNLSELFVNKQPSSQTFQVIAENGGIFTTIKGSTITIPPNAFVTQNGTLITGTVSFKIKEIFSTSDIIYSKVFPISDNNLLNSGGEFFLEAKQNGNVLRIANGVLLDVQIPAQAVAQNMQFFLGGPNELDSVNWQVADSTFSGGNGFTFNATDSSYNCNIDSLGWSNIDGFMSSITYFDCAFQLNGVSGLDISNTNAFAKFVGYNAVWPVGVSSWGNISSNLITETHLGAVELNLIVISVVNSQLYAGLLHVTPQANQTYQVNMNPITSQNLDALINGLP